MRIRLTAIATALLIGTATLPALASDKCNVPKDEWQAAQELQAKLEAQGWKIQRLKTDDGCYEVRGTDAEGHRIRVKIDPGNLDLVEMRIRYRDRDGRRTGSPEGDHD